MVMYCVILLLSMISQIAMGDERIAQCSELQLDKICAREIKTQCLRSRVLETKRACIEKLKVDEFCSDKVTFNNVCAQTANIGDECVNRLCAQTIWTNSILSSNVCANSVEQSTPFKAWLSFSADTLYNLGATIDFDTIVDDPNGDVVLAPTRYIAPRSGYYSVTLGIGITTLTGPSVIAGTPIAVPEVVVNGLLALKSFSAFLEFGIPFQHNTISGLVHLNAGDVVTARYELLILDPLTGVQAYPGQVTLDALGLFSQPFTQTYLIIHYLSSDADGIECPSCPLTCTGTCQPCQPDFCIPCEDNDICVPPCHSNNGF